MLGRMRGERTVPLVLLTGFLGSGKSTFISNLLRGPGGKRLGVLLNEQGSVLLETSLVRQGSSRVRELDHACLCCAGPDDMEKGLKSLLTQSPPLDGILVEASGLTHPGPVVRQLVDRGPDLGVELLGVVGVVDGLAGGDFDRQFTLLNHQLEPASVVVLTKTDTLTPGEGMDRRGWWQARWSAKPVVLPTEVGSWDQLCTHLGEPPQAETTSPFLQKLVQLHGIQSLVLESEGQFDPGLLGAFLKASAPRLLRAKGSFRLSSPGKPGWQYLYQQAGEIRHLTSVKNTLGPTSTLVVYGTDLPVKDLQEGFIQCLGSR